MPKRLIAKAGLVVAQASWIVILVGYLVFRSGWVVLPGFVSIAYLMTLRCSQCLTSFQDRRVYERFRLLKFYDTRIVDACPVCHKPMFPN
jgi:hypothetical protein